jgi:hypothetical protein
VPSVTTTDRTAAAIRHAQLADMKIAEIAAYLRSKGYTVSARPFFGAARLLAPMADEDEIDIPSVLEVSDLPFDAERDRRDE